MCVCLCVWDVGCPRCRYCNTVRGTAVLYDQQLGWIGWRGVISWIKTLVLCIWLHCLSDKSIKPSLLECGAECFLQHYEPIFRSLRLPRCICSAFVKSLGHHVNASWSGSWSRWLTQHGFPVSSSASGWRRIREALHAAHLTEAAVAPFNEKRPSFRLWYISTR